MDAASVAMVSLKLGVGLFETYRCDHPVNLGVNMKTMAMALKCAENDDPCTIEFNASNDDSNLLLEFVNEVDRSKQVCVLVSSCSNQSLADPHALDGHRRTGNRGS